MLRPAILALVRQVLTVAGTALVAKGYIEASDVEPVIGAMLTLGSVVWSRMIGAPDAALSFAANR